MLQPSCWQLLLLLMCTAHATPDTSKPGWLLGLPQLLQQHQPADTDVSGRIQSVTPEQHTTHAGSFGQLLRPKAVPAPMESEHTATLQATAHAANAQPTLASVAKTYGVSPSQLRHMMERDEGLLVAHNGLLVWTCAGADAHSPDGRQPGAGWEDLSNSNGGVGMSGQDSSSSSEGINSSSMTEPDMFEGVTAVTAATAALQAVSSMDGFGLGDADDGPVTVVIPPTAAAMPVDSQAKTLWPTTARAGPPEATATLQSTTTHPHAPSASISQAIPPSSSPAGAKVHQQPGPQPSPQDAFKLHNRAPGSVPHTIFLDFRGCSIANTAWNAATHKPVLQTQPYDLDGDPSSFSVREQQALVSIWQAVAQDFAPWQVDVTTEDPGRDALVKDSAEDARFGMHVCVGGSSASTVGGMSGGLAFTGAWGQLGPGLQPVLVFPAQLGDGHPRAVADSISHEVGHTLGLSHFGGAGAAPYNDGSGPWGPLLGLPYGRVLSQWFTGTAVDDAPQDDLHLIAQQLPLLEDDHGGSPTAATALCSGQGTHPVAAPVSQGPGPVGHAARLGSVCRTLQGSPAGELSSAEPLQLVQAGVRGVISNSSDTDWFEVHVGRAGPMHVELCLPRNTDGYGVNNLLAAVTVWDSQDKQLATAQPQNGSEVVLQVSADIAQPGVYFISAAPTGIDTVSSYGSLGDYLLLVTFPVQGPLVQAQPAAGSAAGLHAAHPQQALKCVSHTQGFDQGSCACDASKGLTLQPIAAAPGDASDAGAGVRCQYQDVRPLSFSPRTCSTAAAGATVLLNFTVSSPPACFADSIIAAAPHLQQLDRCPCRSRALHTLPVPHAGARVRTDGSFACGDGVFSYGWQVPHMAPGCYRLTVAMSDGSSAVTVLKLVDQEGEGGMPAGPVAS